MKTKSGRLKVKLHVKLDHQVKFGEHVVIIGSTKDLGSWKKGVPMSWTESGWVCDLELREGEDIEFKFVITRTGKSLVWEDGENRVLKLPRGGKFSIVARWNTTKENLELLPLDHAGDEEDDKNLEDKGSEGNGGATLLEAEPSPFVGQWQGKAASFMQSNEHRNRESERKWDTTGLEGVALKLVEDDQKARNWWRKVTQLIIFSAGVFI